MGWPFKEFACARGRHAPDSWYSSHTRAEAQENEGEDIGA